jgi:hypothetical protein
MGEKLHTSEILLAMLNYFLFSLYSKTDGELDVNLNDHDGG